MKQFKTICLWKSLTVWGTKNTFYIFCYNFTNNNYKDDIKEYIVQVKNTTSKFNTEFIGDNKSFNIITNMMNTIYIKRINCWFELMKQ